MGLNRRQLIAAAAAAGAGAAVAPFGLRLGGAVATAQTALVGVTFDAAPFTLGVASGDPTADGVVLWTRLAPEPLTDGDGGLAESVDVQWVVAEDPRLRRVVRQGTASAVAGMAHSIHVPVDGLEAGTTYFYRFSALGRVSRIGRTRTTPAPGAAALRLAYVSCANFQHGFFGAYRNLAREDVDAVICLGDYLYEYRTGEFGGFRRHQDFETIDVPTYRQRHALYKGDPDLRAAHAAFPWIVTWDDHEVDNDYADLIPENDLAAENNASTEAFAERRAAAYQAYYEHLPIRLTETGPPDGPDFRIYRQIRFGDLLDVSVLDTRQYRSDQPCADQNFLAFRCAEQDAPERTMLGEEQKGWLKSNLESSTTAWRLLANQLIFAPLFSTSATGNVPGMTPSGPAPADGNLYFNPDQWNGYLAERQELSRFLAESEIPETLVITGDIHSHWVFDVPADPDADPSGPIVATEFVGTSITSDGFDEAVGEAGEQFARADFYANNPQLRLFEGNQHGYAILEVTPDAVTNTFRVINDREDPRATVSTLAVARRERGSTEVQIVESDVATNPRRPA